MEQIRLFDTHAHLDDDQFDENRKEIVDQAVLAGVEYIVTVGTTLAASRKCVRIAHEFGAVRAAVGIQPNYVAEATDDDWQGIVQLAGQPRVVAIGETGLDHYWEHAPIDRQVEFFERHLALSQSTGLPFIVHMRNPKPDSPWSPTACSDLLLEVMSRQPQPLNGVMHSFTGSWRHAEAFLELGLHISFAGMVTFKKSIELRDVAAQVPEDRLLIETDAPYLSPHPLRGQRPNRPAWVRHTAACIADVRGIGLNEMTDLTFANAKALFQIR